MNASLGRRARDSRGQSMSEFAILVPAFLIVLFGLLEFGFAFSHHLTLEYASREGARVGSALGNGTDTSPCNGTNPEPVDWQIIAAVQRVLTSAGSPVPLNSISNISIYKSDSSGNPGLKNVWVPGAGGQSVDTVPLQFHETSHGWDACTRKKSPIGAADSLGVSITYTYQFATPLGALLRTAGLGSLTINDRTVMALNPFQNSGVAGS